MRRRAELLCRKRPRPLPHPPQFAQDQGSSPAAGMTGGGWLDGTGRGRNVRRTASPTDGGSRTIALALASTPVAVLLAVAVMTTMHNPAYDIPPGRLLSCYHNLPPPYPGHEDEVRAIVARGAASPAPGRYATKAASTSTTSQPTLGWVPTWFIGPYSTPQAASPDTLGTGSR